jgi:hypothetical protein
VYTTKCDGWSRITITECGRVCSATLAAVSWKIGIRATTLKKADAAALDTPTVGPVAPRLVVAKGGRRRESGQQEGVLIGIV